MKRHIFSLAVLACSMSIFAQLPYQNPALSPEERAEDLLLRLNLQEKVTLMQNTSKGIDRLGIKPYDWWNEALWPLFFLKLSEWLPLGITSCLKRYSLL